MNKAEGKSRSRTKQTRIEMPWKTIDEAILFLRQLWSRIAIAESEFIRYAMMLEDSDLWRPHRSSKDVTFGHFLNRNKVCSADFYDRRAAVLRDATMSAAAEEVGLPAMALVAEVQDLQTRARTIESLRSYSIDNQKYVPTRTARQLLSQAGVEPKVRASTVGALTSALRAEKAKTKELERQLREAHARIGSLEKENQELRERLGDVNNSSTKNRTVARAPATGKRGSRNHAALRAE